MVNVLFVCLGNICRSPTAHGVFAHQVAESGLSSTIRVDSAGTSGWHNGAKPDSRSMAYAAQNGYDLSFIRSRQVSEDDFIRQDLILAMDAENFENLKSICPPKHLHKVKLFLNYADLPVNEVPDPYYGGDDGFHRVLNLVELGGIALLEHIKQGLE
ncbi:low molecular weight protein-tyrosine-phosphatase [uncultured Endozoicomonas sp.]|uniref:low molecular weight protein-tyrosine-phosphatase n=1 Tax=uncultured Endozoicomonas sp. TaxID=432652 RepID=UPI0026262DEE|nr:low molecular weight protein-tyrosine-phosphatase [uncultured Endozoicomonas sp.]